MANGAIRLGPLLLTKPVGRGGMGTVWHARHPDGVEVAVKVLRPEYAGQEDLAEAFRREVQAVASMDHPGVVRVFDYGAVSDKDAERFDDQIAARSPWLSMEYAEGGTVGDGGPLASWPELRDTLLQVVDGLAHSHAREIVHRDLKPRNVLVHPRAGRTPRITLTDYGIAHALNQRSTHRAQAGTPGYMAPEQIRGDWRDLGPWSDLYSLGALAWKLCTGRSAFQADRPPAILYAQIHGKLGPFEPVMEVPPGFQAWVRRLLEVDPANRYPSAADASQALNGLEWEDTGPAPIPRDWRPRHPPTTVRPAGTGLALFVLRPWPLVGREAIQDSLWNALRETAASGVAECVVLAGAKGIGKSRLAHWLAERAQETGAAWVLRPPRRTRSGKRAGPSLVLAARSLLRLEEIETSEARTRLTAWLAARASPDPEGEAEDLVSLLVTGGPRKDSAEDAWFRLLDRMGHDRPVVVVVDDLHHEPEATEFLRALVGTERHVLAIATLDRDARPRFRATYEELRDEGRWIDIEPLTDTQMRQVVDAGVGLVPRLAEQVVARTAGDPSLAVKVVSDWARRRRLVPTSTGFGLRDEARSQDPLVEEMDQRLAGSTDDEILALELLAALGPKRVRDQEWRLACDEAGIPFPADLPARLLGRGHLTTSDDGDADRWAVNPPALRELLLRRAELGERTKSHNEAGAKMLLQQPRASARERAVMHFVHAGLPSRALSTLRSLIDETERHQEQWQRLPTLLATEGRLLDAMRISATDHRRLPNQIDLMANDIANGMEPDPAAARRLLDRAVAFGDPRLCAKASRIVLTREAKVGRLHPDDTLIGHAHDWHAAANDPRGQSRVAYAHATAAWRDLDGETADRELTDALALCDVTLERARILALLGEVRSLMQDDDEGERLLEEARAAFLAQDRPADASAVSLTRSRIARTLGDPIAALDHARRAQTELKALGVDATAADLQVGLTRLVRGELAQARIELARAVKSATAEVALVARGAILVCFAGDDWEEFDLRLEAWREVAGEDPLGGTDAAWPLEWAAKRALDGGAPDRAIELYELAAYRYRLAGDEPSAERVEKRKRQIPE